MDETTFPFSRKVLDRAITIEFNYFCCWLSSPSISLNYAADVGGYGAVDYDGNIVKDVTVYVRPVL